MARNVGVSIENAFNRGLITEVTGVNSPENSVTSTLNIIYDRRGKAIKRPAFDYEPGYSLRNLSTSGVYTEYVWNTISSNIGKDFVVLQIGSTIRFFESVPDSALSPNLKSFSINLLSYRTPNFSAAQVQSTAASYTSGRGYLFIAHPHCDTIYVKYDAVNDTISVNRITLTIRDFEGLTDNLPVDRRPTSLSSAHKYNLYNQGWYADVADGDNIQGNALAYWDAGRTDFPSNVDVWWYYTGVTPSASQIEFFDPKTVPSRTGLYGNTPAPRGHYIVNALQTNRSTLSGISGITESSSDGLRPSTVAFYAGRVFYAGVGKSKYSSLVYFSQIVERDDQLGKCYQASDPTSREIFDLVDSDGGVVDIQDINTIFGMMVVGQALIIFASNGIWSISGTDNGPFRATDYSVSKITSETAISRLSIVEVSGYPIWWNHEGIYSLKTSETGLTTDVTSLTVQTIQTFYDKIPYSSKIYAKGAYNNQSNLIYWIYSTSDTPTDYDRILVLDAETTAFYVLTLPVGTRQIRGLLAVRATGPSSAESLVITSLNDNVVTLDGAVYVIEELGQIAREMDFRFITTQAEGLTFSYLKSNQYLDWGSDDYEASFISGYRIRGEILRKSQTNYLQVVMEHVDNSSCYVQGVWDYANSHLSGRYTNPQQAYRQTDYDFDYYMSRLKIRGTGTALQFRFYGTYNAPMVVIGWAGYETANGAP